MKRFMLIIIALIMLLSLPFTVYAEEGEAVQNEVTEDISQPRLLVTGYKLDTKYLTPGKKSTLSVTLKNYSPNKAIKNIKLSFSEESGDVKPVGTGTQYVSSISAGAVYTWEIALTASATAAIGEHAVTINSEYEDKYYAQYSESDTIRLNVRQSVGIDFSGFQLPAKITQEDTVTLDLSFMNTGKSKIRNLKVKYKVKGLESGGSTYIGEIEAGDSGTASSNLRVSSEILGEISGKAIISFEDEFGKTYKEKVNLSSEIQKKAEPKAEQEEETKKNPQWWLFLIIGLASGGGIGVSIPIMINARKQRLIDEQRL